jgi:hypothetical protein
MSENVKTNATRGEIKESGGRHYRLHAQCNGVRPIRSCCGHQKNILISVLLCHGDVVAIRTISSYV